MCEWLCKSMSYEYYLFNVEVHVAVFLGQSRLKYSIYMYDVYESITYQHMHITLSFSSLSKRLQKYLPSHQQEVSYLMRHIICFLLHLPNFDAIVVKLGTTVPDPAKEHTFTVSIAATEGWLQLTIRDICEPLISIQRIKRMLPAVFPSLMQNSTQHCNPKSMNSLCNISWVAAYTKLG